MARGNAGRARQAALGVGAANRKTGKYASPWHEAIADKGTILRTEVGSGVHGTNVEEHDDTDEMGVCIEPPETVIGLRIFEQYEWHSAWERPGGLANRSGPGDLDINVYSLRKWTRLALNGNPSVLMLLFAPQGSVRKITDLGHELREQMPEHILSRQAGKRFMGYLNAQRKSMLSHEGKGRDVTRPELVEKYGFDTKFGGHMVRLGHQGLELMTTGRITLPMPYAQRQLVKDIRAGEYPMHDVLDMALELEHAIEAAMTSSSLSEYPDYEFMNTWLKDSYLWSWTCMDVLGSLPDYRKEDP
jgi:hypothetical protein